MKSNKIAPEKFFLWISIIMGICLCIIIPVGAGYDEDTHEARIWEISRGVMVPNGLLSTGPNFPSIFYELSYRQKYILDPVGLNFYKDNLFKKIDWNNMIYHETRSYYFPLLYLPQAFIMGLFGRLFDAPILLILFLCRLSYLFIYVVMGYWAIKKIPFGKWVFCVLALAPMAITQASIISADPLTNIGSYFFIAHILELRTLKSKLSNKDVILLIGAIALLFSLKINAIVLITLLLLLPKRIFQERWQIVLIILSILFLFLVFVIGWNFIALSQRTSILTMEGVNAFEQMKFILFHPFQTLSAIFNSIRSNGITYMREWIGVMGYRYWGYPEILYPLFILLLCLAVVKDATSLIDLQERIFLVITFVLGIITTATAIYVVMNPVGSSLIDGIDGRQLIPIMPLFFLAIIPTKFFKIDISDIFIIAGNTLILLLVLFSSFLVYHVNCGMSYYTGGGCFLPVYKNWDPNLNYSGSLGKGVHYIQSFQANCSPLSEVKLWVKKPNQFLENAISKVVIRIQANNKIIFEKDIKNQDAGLNGLIDLKFSPVINSMGNTFEIDISAEANPNEGISLSLSSRDEYKQGEFKIGAETQLNDLIFQYGCDIGT
jgi:uncharacterized membrane protein